MTPWCETPNLRQSPSLSLPRSHHHPQLRASPSSPAPASLKCLPGAQRTQPSPAATGPEAASAGSFTRVLKEPLRQATPSQAWRGGTQRGRGGVQEQGRQREAEAEDGGEAGRPKPPLHAESGPGPDRQCPCWFLLCVHACVNAHATPLQESCHQQLRDQEIANPLCFEDVSIQADQKSSPEAAVSLPST